MIHKNQIYKKLMMDTSTVLMKHAAAVHINNQLTMNQRKVANILLLNAYDSGANKSWYTMPVRDLLLSLGWKDSSNTTDANHGLHNQILL